MPTIELKLSLDNLQEVARDFLKLQASNRKLAFYGQMGAGKTTFITALCKELGVIDMVSSPTFAIVNEYSTDQGEEVFHFDFYRINEVSELYDIGFEEYCMRDNWCFVEWPEKGEQVLTEDFITVNITIRENGERLLVFEC